jgi:2'-5' RNA ligase
MDMTNEKVPESLRIFLAIDLAEEVRAGIAAAQNLCRERLTGTGLKWTRPEQFHLTLRFLGQVEAKALTGLTAKVRPACAGLKPLELRGAKLGVFPERGRPRVLWVGVYDDGAHGLEQTFRVIAEATRGFGQQETEKAFTGHITLARGKDLDRVTAAKLRELVRGFSGGEFGSWRATDIQVMRSELSSQGATHSVLERVPLGGAQVDSGTVFGSTNSAELGSP